MKKSFKTLFAAGLILTLGACSSSQTTEENADGLEPAAEEAMPAADAGTDAVPMATVENPEADPAAFVDPAADPYADSNADPNVVLQPEQAPADAQAMAQPEAQPPADAQPLAQPAYAEATTPPSPAGSGQFDDVTVQPGDTLMKIAFETYGDLYRWKGILEANRDKISDPSVIPAGTVLKVERPATAVAIEKNGERYLIKSGDTLGTISQDVYGTRSKWKRLWENNRQLIHDPNRIFAGFHLYYQPDGSMPPQEAPTLQPAPLADTGQSAPVDTATTSGDAARVPASDPPPAADGAVPAYDQQPQTVTQ